MALREVYACTLLKTRVDTRVSLCNSEAHGVLVEFVTVTQTLECVSVSNKFREFSQPYTRDKMKG